MPANTTMLNKAGKKRFQELNRAKAAGADVSGGALRRSGREDALGLRRLTHGKSVDPNTDLSRYMKTPKGEKVKVKPPPPHTKPPDLGGGGGGAGGGGGNTKPPDLGGGGKVKPPGGGGKGKPPTKPPVTTTPKPGSLTAPPPAAIGPPPMAGAGGPAPAFNPGIPDHIQQQWAANLQNPSGAVAGLPGPFGNTPPGPPTSQPQPPPQPAPAPSPPQGATGPPPDPAAVSQAEQILGPGNIPVILGMQSLQQIEQQMRAWAANPAPGTAPYSEQQIQHVLQVAQQLMAAGMWGGGTGQAPYQPPAPPGPMPPTPSPTGQGPRY